MLESEVKNGKANVRCSVTERLCKCANTCAAAEEVPDSPGVVGSTDGSLRWTKSAIIKIDAAITEVELALGHLPLQRPRPGPELREAGRKLEAVRNQLYELLS